MNKKYLTITSVVIGILILVGAGCGKNASTNEEKNTADSKKEESKSEKVTTNKNAQEIINDLRSALAKVFGDAKLTSNQQNLLGKKGWTGISFSVGRDPGEADVVALNSALGNIGYKFFRSETTDDASFGQGTAITYFDSQNFLVLSYYANRKNVEIMLTPADEARKMMEEDE